jgi:hypothetical protein
MMGDHPIQVWPPELYGSQPSLLESGPVMRHHTPLTFVELRDTTDSLLRVFTGRLLDELGSQGHRCCSVPDNSTDAVFSTARFGEAVGWRQAPLFCLRSRFGLTRSPMTFTFVHATKEELDGMLSYLQGVLEKPAPDPEDYNFHGLMREAYRVLYEQGRRGGPMLALIRLLQAQTKSIRIVLLVGNDSLAGAYHLDLVGSHPFTSVNGETDFYRETATRIITAVTTREVTKHVISPIKVSNTLWSSLDIPQAMCNAACEFGNRGLFTEMVRIADLISVPAVSDALAAQYSEGCLATWEPRLAALITTVSGSCRSYDKSGISDNDLVVAYGIRPDGLGAIVQHVDGKENVIPSSETVEMLLIDKALPTRTLDHFDGSFSSVPVIRSKLHIHRGICSFDSRYVEYAPLPVHNQKYLVSCATEAQAAAVTGAFSGSSALQDPSDTRQLVFTVLPGHGVIMAEKWVNGKRPFQLMWEFIDSGVLEIENTLPQGPLCYVPDRGDRMQLVST